MGTAQDIATVERRAAAAGISMAAVLRRAELAPTTWVRWKNRDMKPQGKNWRRVLVAIAALEAEVKKEMAAVE